MLVLLRDERLQCALEKYMILARLPCSHKTNKYMLKSADLAQPRSIPVGPYTSVRDFLQAGTSFDMDDLHFYKEEIGPKYRWRVEWVDRWWKLLVGCHTSAPAVVCFNTNIVLSFIFFFGRNHRRYHNNSPIAMYGSEEEHPNTSAGYLVNHVGGSNIAPLLKRCVMRQ